MLKQTAESPDRLRPLQLGDGRTLVDLGTYEDVVHSHDLSSPLALSLEWTIGDAISFDDPVAKRPYRGDALGFECVIEADARHQPVTRSFKYCVMDGGKKALEVEMIRREGRSQRKKAEFDLAAVNYELRRHVGRPWPLPPPVRFYGFPDEATAYYQNTAFAADLVLELERLLKSIYYLGPLREHPRRLYLWSGEVPDHVGERGDRAVEAVLAARDRAFNFKTRQRTKALQAVVAERLRAMRLIEGFRIKALGEHRKEYEVLVKTAAKLPDVKLTDVGFGVSQMLPVIVECFYVPRRSIVILEQPEIHLHPSVQADLADLFVDAIRAREGGEPRDIQLIVESHSEHFLRRLQRRIAERELAPEDAALYFVHTKGGHARIDELDIDLFGNIRNWPDGFFGDEMEDLVARAEAQARARREGSR